MSPRIDAPVFPLEYPADTGVRAVPDPEGVGISLARCQGNRNGYLQVLGHLFSVLHVDLAEVVAVSQGVLQLQDSL